jgi:hypothetical protein
MIFVRRSNRNEVPGLVELMVVLVEDDLGSLVHVPAPDVDSHAVVGRLNRVSSSGSLSLGRHNPPLLIGGSIRLTHVQLNASLGVGVVGDLKSTSVFGVSDEETAVSSGLEVPLLVGVAVHLPEDQLVGMVMVLAGIQSIVGILGTGDDIFLVGVRLESSISLPTETLLASAETLLASAEALLTSAEALLASTEALLSMMATVVVPSLALLASPSLLTLSLLSPAHFTKICQL